MILAGPAQEDFIKQQVDNTPVHIAQADFIKQQVDNTSVHIAQRDISLIQVVHIAVHVPLGDTTPIHIHIHIHIHVAMIVLQARRNVAATSNYRCSYCCVCSAPHVDAFYSYSWY